MSRANSPSPLPGNSRGPGQSPNIAGGGQDVKVSPRLPAPPQSVCITEDDDIQFIACIERVTLSPSTSNQSTGTNSAPAERGNVAPSTSGNASSAQGQVIVLDSSRQQDETIPGDEEVGALGHVDVIGYSKEPVTNEDSGMPQRADVTSTLERNCGATGDNDTEQEVPSSAPVNNQDESSPASNEAERPSATRTTGNDQEGQAPSNLRRSGNEAGQSFPRRPEQESQERRLYAKRASYRQHSPIRPRPYDPHRNRRSDAQSRGRAHWLNHQQHAPNWEIPNWSPDHCYRDRGTYYRRPRSSSREEYRQRSRSSDRDRRGSGERGRSPGGRGRWSGEGRRWSGEGRRRSGEGRRRSGEGRRRSVEGRRRSPNRNPGDYREERRRNSNHSSDHHDNRHRERNPRRSPSIAVASTGTQTSPRNVAPQKFTAQQILDLIRTCNESGCHGAQFGTRKQATLHLKEDHNKQLCFFCFMPFSSKGLEHLKHYLDAHAEGEGETAECPTEGCPWLFSYKGIYGHLSRCHLVPVEGDD